MGTDALNPTTPRLAPTSVHPKQKLLAATPGETTQYLRDKLHLIFGPEENVNARDDPAMLGASAKIQRTYEVLKKICNLGLKQVMKLKIGWFGN